MSKRSAPGVIFDLDGVLTLTGPAHRQSWYELAEKYNLTMTDAFFRKTFGMQNDQILPLLLGRPAPPEEIEEMSEQKEAGYRRIVASQLAPAPGVLDLLEDLRQQGFAPGQDLIAGIAEAVLDVSQHA